MDPDISRWVLEFLLRSSVTDSLLRKALTVLPLSAVDSRIKKTLLLRTLHSDLLRASLSETALQILEILANYPNDAHPVPDSMRRAYCAVAVECTVKYLAASPDHPSGEYLDAVQRIWRGRVAALEAEGRGSDLFSDELMQWRNDIEAALADAGVRERLASLNCRREALNKVRVYLKEEWEMMGPSFLESVAKLSNVKGLCPEGVCRIAFSAKPLREWKEGLQGSMKEKGESDSGADRGDNGNVSGNAGDNGNVSGNTGDNGNVNGNAGDNGNVSGNAVDNGNVSGNVDDNDNGNENDHNCDDDGGASIEGVAVRDENWGKEPLEERVDDLPGQRDKVRRPPLSASSFNSAMYASLPSFFILYALLRCCLTSRGTLLEPLTFPLILIGCLLALVTPCGSFQTKITSHCLLIVYSPQGTLVEESPALPC